MSILSDRVREQVRASFSSLVNPVRLVFFEQTLNCETCPDARRLAEEVAALSDKISFEAYNLMTDREKAAEYGVDAVPALAVVGDQDQGIRFYGTPSGYEFGALVETIQDVSARRIGLSEKTIEALSALTTPVHLRVFVTPT